MRRRSRSQCCASRSENAGDSDPLLVAQLLPALVEAQIACGDRAGAADAAERLAGIARVYCTVVLEARAGTCRARVALAAGATDEAVAAARAAVNLWRDAGAPYEAAQTQQLLAEAALRAGDRQVATVELDAALAVFSDLGAARDVEAAQRLRDRAGDATIGRQVRRTFMFTDIVDSTQLVAKMGDEQWSAVLRSHDRTIRDLLARHNGSEVKQRGGGDGFFAVFETPGDAVDCAVAIQRAFAASRHNGFAPEVRIGVHEADVLLSGNDFAGLGVHEAARIAAHAGGSCVLASAATVAACGASADRAAARGCVQGTERSRRRSGNRVERDEGRIDMTEAYELRNLVEAEQADFVELLKGLMPEKGLRLVAPDIVWWSGTGPEVRGPGETLLMALNGRGPALADLTGDGVPVLAGRIRS